MSRRTPIPHGTEAGYRKHVRRGEPSCDPCKKAANIAIRERERRRLEEDVELTGGRWVPRRGIQIWESTDAA